LPPVTRKRITQLARELRKKQTPEENVLWQLVRNRKLGGYKFLRQYPIVYSNDRNGNLLFFIADFYCHEQQLVVELDGIIHDNQKENDQQRDLILNDLGLRVVRFTNEAMENPEVVVKEIENILCED
jgi:leucyl-tRNA synthetase